MITFLSSFDLDSLLTVEAVLSKLDAYLKELQIMCEGKQKFTLDEQKVLDANLVFIKRFYEKAELLLLNSSNENRPCGRLAKPLPVKLKDVRRKAERNVNQ